MVLDTVATEAITGAIAGVAVVGTGRAASGLYVSVLAEGAT